MGIFDGDALVCERDVAVAREERIDDARGSEPVVRRSYKTVAAHYSCRGGRRNPA